MTSDERFQHLRKLLSVSFTERVMRQLEAAYAEWPEEDDKALARDYIDAHLMQWGRSIDEFTEEQDLYAQPAFESGRVRVYKEIHESQRRIPVRRVRQEKKRAKQEHPHRSRK